MAGTPEKTTEEKLRALARAAEALNRSGVVWALGASAMLYLRGLAGTFHDIDLMVTEADADAARAILDRLGTRQPPHSAGTYRTRVFLEYEVEGVEFDLIAGFVIVSGGQSHSCPLRPEDIDGEVSVLGQRIPLHSLACWQRCYALMGRAEKAALCAAGRERG